LVLGIVVGEHQGPGTGTTELVLAGLMFVVAVVTQGRIGLVLGLGACLLVGSALSQRALHGLEHSPIARAGATRAEVTVEAPLTDDPDGTRFTTRTLARVRRFRSAPGRWHDGGGRTVAITAVGTAGSRLGVLSAGDEVRVRGLLAPLTGY